MTSGPWSTITTARLWWFSATPRPGSAMSVQPSSGSAELTDSYFQSYPSFWPENQKSKKYGQVFTVEYVSHNHYPNIRYVVRLWAQVVKTTQNREQRNIINYLSAQVSGIPSHLFLEGTFMLCNIYCNVATDWSSHSLSHLGPGYSRSTRRSCLSPS